MPQLSVFRKGQDVHDGNFESPLPKSVSANHDLLAACPILAIDKQLRQQQQLFKKPVPNYQSKSMRTSKSDVLLSTVGFQKSDVGRSTGCTQFGSCQLKSGKDRVVSGASIQSPKSPTSTSTVRPNGFETLRKNSSSIISRIHALTTHKCLLVSNSSRSSLLTPVGHGASASSSSAFLPPSASKCSMTSGCSAASIRANCKLCLSDIRSVDLYELNSCRCTFCRQCVEQYVKIQILDGNIVIACPDGECPKKGVISIQELQLLADDDLYNKYKRFKVNTEVDLDQNRTWCPTPGCETICAVTSPIDGSISGKWQALPITCPTCSMTYCSSCKVEWPGEHTCKLYMKKKKPIWFLGSDDRIVFSGGEDAPIKHCPLCRIPIERDSGCAQMMCKKCKHVFCWYCLASLDDDFLLRHYDKGPCKNKLGHSRASVIWHRTQVIGIFAGVGILVLLASPLLIVAAPFVVCCKCKACDRCHDPSTDQDMVPVNL